MNQKPNLSITRAQFASQDDKLRMVPKGKPQHLVNPLTEGEAFIMVAREKAETPEQFVAFLFAATPPKVQRDMLLRRFKNDSLSLKAKGVPSAAIRYEKAMWMARWVDRMENLLMIPPPYVKAWMKGLGMFNKKGKLTVEFGGKP